MRLAKGKGYGSKEAVPRHRTQSRASSDRQERAIEKQVRWEGRRASREVFPITERVVTTTDAWGRTIIVGGHILVRGLE